MKNVLVVSRFFPPLNNMAAKRFGTMCRYFEGNGYRTSVLTTSPHANCYLNAKLDFDVPEGLGEIIQIGRTGAVYVPETVFSQMVIQWLDKGNRQTRTLAPTSLGWYEKVKREVDISRLKGTDIIIGTYPAMENLLIASYLSRMLKCPFVADIRDLITEYAEDTGGRIRSFRLDALVEKALLRRASGIVPVTDGFGKILKKKYPQKRMKVIYNGWEDAGNPVEEPEQGRKYLYYAGSLYSHRLESFGLLMDCLGEAVKTSDIRMKIRSVGPGHLDARIRRMIKDNGMARHIEVLEAAEESIVKKEQAGAYINVVLGSLHEEDKALLATVPGKVYEVLRNHAPVLAIAPESSDIAAIIGKTGKGIASAQREKITRFILDPGADYAGNRYVDFFSRKRQAERYCRFLDSILACGTGKRRVP